jgi:Cu(I)/Ag(I) efflux system membrane fusion protein
MTRLASSKVIALAASSLLVLLLAGLFMQHTRHGWPFSLHHAVGTESPPRRTALASDAAHPVSHTRAPVEIPAAQLDTLSVRTERARKETIARPIRAVATVVPDETRVSHVHTRVAGWIEALYVNTTGQRVRAGQRLAGIFSQELLSSQTEYLTARRAASTGQRSVVLEGARARLAVLGMTEAEIRGIEERGAPQRLVTVIAPRGGVVLHRGISVGTAVDPSTELVTIADLSRVWILAEVPEADVPSIDKGAVARLDFPGSGPASREARVEFLYPTLSERTRSLRVRFVVDNPDGALRPGLYGNAEFQVAPREALTVSRDAVVDTGAEQHVFVVAGPGRFEPRSVKLGIRLQDRVEVRDGLAEGDEVVASGVFLIDSESRLRASGGAGVGHGGHGAPTQGAPEARPEQPETTRRGHEGH